MSMYKFLQYHVGEFMTGNPVSVGRDLTLKEVEDLLHGHDFNALPVTENGKLVGIATKFDFLKAFAFSTRQLVPHYDELMSRKVGDVMTVNVVTVEPTSPLTRALQLMVDLKARSLPVVEDDKLVGMISRTDLMKALKQSVEASE
jgi:CBS domain-containing protein